MSADNKFLTLKWEDIENAVAAISEKIIESNFNPNVVVGILRGGWIPARIFADFLGIKNIGAIEIKFYKGIEEKMERPVITQPLVLDIRNKNVLLVDDVADSGKSLQTALSAINFYGPKNLKTVSLYVKPWSVIIPDYYYGETDKWIVFPWEKRETIEALVQAEYKIISRATIDVEKISKEFSDKLGLSYEEVKRIITLIISERSFFNPETIH
ncbi:phosphoribosyltransferase [Fervidicoccus fontis]|uniref:Phosphoribosyltransferase n=1 Tax=Fervidicoccus fontis TaxID=683846 RepID=A0A843AES8_9CREN|nr:phosphoribosyltransferase [Fervidicoccus fontis]MBE9391586.1 phosphoribosyltransferase [Fervidicoccus fontis]